MIVSTESFSLDWQTKTDIKGKRHLVGLLNFLIHGYGVIENHEKMVITESVLVKSVTISVIFLSKTGLWFVWTSDYLPVNSASSAIFLIIVVITHNNF